MDKKRGITLIEMMVAVAIVAILASLAYPSYQANVNASRRADAQAALLGFAQAMERFYTNNGTYMGAAASGNDTGAPAIFATTAPVDSSDIYYNLEIQSAAVNSYVLEADPVGAQAGNGELLLKSTGIRGWDADNSGDIGTGEWSW